MKNKYAPTFGSFKAIKLFLAMIETYQSKVHFPFEVSEVSSQVVKSLEDENYFDSHFEYPDQARTLFYERFAFSLVIKFIDGTELIWCDKEFEVLIIKTSVEQLVYELEINEIVDVFDDELGEKIVVLRKDKMDLVL